MLLMDHTTLKSYKYKETFSLFNRKKDNYNHFIVPILLSNEGNDFDPEIA